MSRTFKEACAELPDNLADAVTAVVVAKNFRAEDVLAVAKEVAASLGDYAWASPRELFYVLLSRLRRDGAKAAEAVLETRRRITITRPGSTNVIRLFIYSTGNADAYVMRESELAREGRRCRDAFYQRLTTRPVDNDNNPIAGAAPGLHTRMAVKGRLAWVAKRPTLRVRGGAWEGG
jgi:hypothetical protein